MTTNLKRGAPACNSFQVPICDAAAIQSGLVKLAGQTV